MRKFILLISALFCLSSFSVPFAGAQVLTRQNPILKPIKRSPAQAASPAPKEPNSTAPGLKKGEFLTIQASNPAINVITPQDDSSSPIPSDKTYFQFSKKNGQLYLGFKSKDPHLRLNEGQPIAIQLMTAPPLQVQPSLILNSDWPKGALEIPVTVTGGQAKTNNQIQGKASYTYCHDTTKACTKALTNIYYFLK